MSELENLVAMSGAVRLPARLDLAVAAPLRQALRDLLDTNTRVSIDAAAVERVATPCVQVLMAAAREARARGVGFAIGQPSPAFAEALADLGIGPDLAIPKPAA